MSEAGKDPAIKLFGRTIAVPEEDGLDHGTAEEAGEDRKENRSVVNDEAYPANDAPKELDHCDKDATSGTSNGHIEDNQPGTLDDMATSNPKSEQNHIETDDSGKEKIINKPDNILPCPRCNSLDTKFCYYNNYNVNQPRHFCKNCQRYWTAGGTMRNVPVGAGRRKNKHSAFHYRQLTMPSDGMPSPCTDIPDPNHGQILLSELPMPSESLNGHGTILKFGTEAPQCESIANAFHLGDHKRDEMVAVACGEPSCSSVKESDCVDIEHPEKAEQVVQNGLTGSCNGLTSSNPLQYYPAPPWAYPWNPMWNNGTPVAAGHCMPGLVYAQESNSPNPIPWNPTPLIAAPFCRPTIPVPFVPASFWGCMSTWASSAWTVPWVGSNVLPPLSCMSNRICSGNNSPKLGKHSRDANTQVAEITERSLWVPKTLRIDDPDEAAKSSIWATLGIKPDRCETGAKGGIFKAFEPKIEHKGHQSDATPVLHANPAALSRSQTFQESS